MKNLIIISIVLIFDAFAPLSAQVNAPYTQYMHNKLLFNPAVSGNSDYLEAAVVYRNQWTGLTANAYTSQNFSIHAPLHGISSGIGLHIHNDMLGAQRATYIAANYAYQLNVGKGRLGFGLYGGVAQISLDGAQLRAPDGNYDIDLGIFTHNDNLIPITKENGIVPDMGLGIYYSDEKLYAGLSSTTIIEAKGKVPSNLSTPNVIFRRNYYGLIGYNIEISKKITATPNVLFSSDLVENQLDANIVVAVNKKVLVGAGYRGYNKKSSESVMLLFGFNMGKKLRLSYSYDINLNGLNDFNSGSHELVLQYKRLIKKEKTLGFIEYNSRFL